MVLTEKEETAILGNEYSAYMGNSVEAFYEIEAAYGNTISSSGTLNNDLKYRFSSKYFDEEFNAYYFNHRYYNPDEGRFISRDPMRERRGGNNLYRYAVNNSISFFDVLGLFKYDDATTKEEFKCSEKQLGILHKAEKTAQAAIPEAIKILKENFTDRIKLEERFPDVKWSDRKVMDDYDSWYEGMISVLGTTENGFKDGSVTVQCSCNPDKDKVAAALLKEKVIRFYPVYFEEPDVSKLAKEEAEIERNLNERYKSSVFLHEMAHIYAGTADIYGRTGAGKLNFANLSNYSAYIDGITYGAEDEFAKQIKKWGEGFFLTRDNSQDAGK